jgi:hypothetical protein
MEVALSAKIRRTSHDILCLFVWFVVKKSSPRLCLQEHRIEQQLEAPFGVDCDIILHGGEEGLQQVHEVLDVSCLDCPGHLEHVSTDGFLRECAVAAESGGS